MKQRPQEQKIPSGFPGLGLLVATKITRGYVLILLEKIDTRIKILITHLQWNSRHLDVVMVLDFLLYFSLPVTVRMVKDPPSMDFFHKFNC